MLAQNKLHINNEEAKPILNWLIFFIVGNLAFQIYYIALGSFEIVVSKGETFWSLVATSEMLILARALKGEFTNGVCKEGILR